MSSPEFSRITPEFSRITPEFSRKTDVRFLPQAPLRLKASAEECAALARRFDLVAVNSLTAELVLDKDKSAITAIGRLKAQIIQRCAVSADDLPVSISEPLRLRFVPAAEHAHAEAEVELDAADCDEVAFTGTTIDLGEELAQSLGVAIDPFLTGPGAKAARAKAGLLDPDAAGPFAALAALKNKG